MTTLESAVTSPPVVASSEMRTRASSKKTLTLVASSTAPVSLFGGSAIVIEAEVRRMLRKEGLRATTILDHDRFIDVIPVRASPGMAIRFLCFKWDLPPERLLVAGDSGNDADMLSGDTLGVVVGNHTPELDTLRGYHRVYFAEAGHARGVLEGIEHYDFFGQITPDREAEA